VVLNGDVKKSQSSHVIWSRLSKDGFGQRVVRNPGSDPGDASPGRKTRGGKGMRILLGGGYRRLTNRFQPYKLN